MLSLLLTLQYKCEATAKVEGFKIKTGGDCPKDVACSKMSYEDAMKIEEDTAKGAVKASGKIAACVTSHESASVDCSSDSDICTGYEKSCSSLCKEKCKKREKQETYKSFYGETESEITYTYYCPKGKQKYGGGLSAGAIAGIVIACVVVVGVAVFCICYFLVCKKGCAKKSQTPVQQMDSQKI